MSANKRHLKEIIKISNFDNDASRRNQVTLPFSMMYTSSDGDHITFMPVYPGNAEYLHMPSGNTPTTTLNCFIFSAGKSVRFLTTEPSVIKKETPY